MVVQKARRKGMKRVAGRGRRRRLRDRESRCWGRGRSVWKIPGGRLVGVASLACLPCLVFSGFPSLRFEVGAKRW
jgi:hypothetical protein